MTKTQHFLRSALIASSIFFIGSATCGKGPDLDIEVWSADSSRQSIRRAQHDQEIFCSDHRFENFACASYTDWDKIDAKLADCEKGK